jgi:hypothetical protein
MYDAKGEDAARKLNDKLGLAPATLSIQFTKFRGGKKKAVKPVSKRVRKSTSDTHEAELAAEHVEA